MKEIWLSRARRELWCLGAYPWEMRVKIVLILVFIQSVPECLLAEKGRALSQIHGVSSVFSRTLISNLGIRIHLLQEIVFVKSRLEAIYLFML